MISDGMEDFRTQKVFLFFRMFDEAFCVRCSLGHWGPTHRRVQHNIHTPPSGGPSLVFGFGLFFVCSHWLTLADDTFGFCFPPYHHRHHHHHRCHDAQCTMHEIHATLSVFFFFFGSPSEHQVPGPFVGYRVPGRRRPPPPPPGTCHVPARLGLGRWVDRFGSELFAIKFTNLGISVGSTPFLLVLSLSSSLPVLSSCVTFSFSSLSLSSSFFLTPETQTQTLTLT